VTSGRPDDDDLDAAVDAEPDDLARLRLLAQHIAEVTAHLAYARQLRDACAVRLRVQGVPMRRVAAVAGVGDSYLARQAGLFRPRCRGSGNRPG
jgi:hypothetical protein